MSKKVLIVEDNEMNMKLFRDVVELCNYQAICLRSGIKATEIALEHEPSLILMDIQLPEISGLEIIEKFKQDPKLKHIPIIAITAFAMKGDEEKVAKTGCEAYMFKPIAIQELREAINRSAK